MEKLIFAEYLGVVLVVLSCPGVQVGGLDAVGPVAQVVDLFVLRDVPSCLEEDSPVCEFLLSVNS